MRIALDGEVLRYDCWQCYQEDLERVSKDRKQAIEKVKEEVE
jgi:hypothetical protein